MFPGQFVAPVRRTLIRRRIGVGVSRPGWPVTTLAGGAICWILAHVDLNWVMARLLLIASLCIVAGAVMAPLLVIASLCIVAGAVMAPLLVIVSLCIVAGA